jgi:hypothetical protein
MATKSKSLKDFQEKLKGFSQKHELQPGSSVAAELETEAMPGKPKPDSVKELPAAHFRVTARNQMDPAFGDAVLQDLIIETPQPAKVRIMRKSPDGEEGTIYETKKRAGETLANVRITVFVDHLEGDKDRFNGNYLKFAISASGQSGGIRYCKAPGKDFMKDLRLPLKQGVYPYTGYQADDKGLEVLSVVKNRLVLQVYDPREEP